MMKRIAALMLLCIALLCVASSSALTVCQNSQDVCFVVQTSSGLPATYYEKQKEFLTMVSRAFYFGVTRSRAAVVSFSEHAHVELALKDGVSSTAFSMAVNSMKESIHSVSDVRSALKKCHEQFKSTPEGMEKIVVIVAKHFGHLKPLKEAVDAVKADKTVIAAVGVEQRYQEYIMKIATEGMSFFPKCQMGLQGIVKEIQRRLCVVCPETTTKQPDGSCKPDCDGLYFEGYKNAYPVFKINDRPIDRQKEECLKDMVSGKPLHMYREKDDYFALWCEEIPAETRVNWKTHKPVPMTCASNYFHIRGLAGAEIWGRQSHHPPCVAGRFEEVMDESYVKMVLKCRLGDRKVNPTKVISEEKICAVFRMRQ